LPAPERKGRAQLRPYKPTLQDEAVNLFAQFTGNDYEARNRARNIFGTFNRMGLLGWTPAGTAFALENAGRTMRRNVFAGAGEAALAVLPVPAAAKAAKRVAAARPKPKGITAYHGSPHTFDQFDTSKIGTGEGAQAYGHGLYFAENEGVAKSYRAIGAPDHLGARQIQVATEALERAKRLGFEGDHAKRFAMDELASAAKQPQAHPPQVYFDAINNFDALTGGPGAPGNMYQVRINADPEEFLDWDAPLSQQSPKVQEALRPFGFNYDHAGEQAAYDAHDKGLLDALMNGGPEPRTPPKQPNPLGANIYESSKLVPGDFRDPVAATNALREAGIPGIRYLDQGSRGAGNGTRNYVVFNAQIVDIMKRYGVAAPVAAAILAGQMQPPEPQR
jgi:hypothetical protein